MPSKCSCRGGCRKQPSYGVYGSNKREFCFEHKRDGMVDLVSKRCAHLGCSKVPSYGVDGSKKKEFCAEHKRDGMVNVKDRSCLHRCCSKVPSYGVDGSSKREFCFEHKRDGMINIASKRCLHHACSKASSFGVLGTRKREFCAEHKKDGMVDLKSRDWSSGEACGSIGRGWVDGLPATGGSSGTVRGAGPGGRSRSQCASEATSRGAKRARRAPAATPVAPTPVRPGVLEGPVPTEGGSQSGSTDAAVKTEPRAFSVGRRGGWR